MLMARGELSFRIRPVSEPCAAKAQKNLKVAPVGPISAQGLLICGY